MTSKDGILTCVSRQNIDIGSYLHSQTFIESKYKEGQNNKEEEQETHNDFSFC